MRIASCLGWAVMIVAALAPAAQAQSAPPRGEMHLQFLVAGGNQAIYVERMTPKIVGSTVETWVFTALPDGKAMSGWLR